MRNREGRSAGTTLIEVLVGCSVFAFVMIASLAIMNIGTSAWRTIEGKSDVTRSLNRFESDIVQELKRASLQSVGIYTPRSDYRWAIWFKTAMNAPGRYDPATGLPLVPLGDASLQVLNTGVPVMQRYVLYYVTRMSREEHLAAHGFLCASYTSGRVPDTECPHKRMVKKDIHLLNPKVGGTDAIGLQGDPATVARLRRYLTSELSESALFAQQASVDSTSNVHRVQVVASGIMGFEVTRLKLRPTDPMSPPVVDPNGPIILFDVKAFKAIAARDKIQVGLGSAAEVQYSSETFSGVPGSEMIGVTTVADRTGALTTHTTSTVAPQYAAFTVQLDNRVVPQNP